jgi:hypothetical protein
MSAFRKILFIAFFLVFMHRTQAFEADLGAGAGFEYSDNIQLVETDKQEDIVAIGVVGLSFIENSEPIIADVAAILRYEDFMMDTFDERLLFSLLANAEWRIAPQRFHWIVQDRFDQLNINALEPSTPDNTQNANAFSTGPDVFFRIGPVNTVELRARFDDTNFEASSADSRRYSAGARWLYDSLPSRLFNRDFFARIDAQRVDFEDEEVNQNFTREDYTLGMDARYSHSEFRIEGGGTSIQREESKNFNGPLFRARWIWSQTSLSRLDVSASTQLTDAGRNLLIAETVADQEALQTEEVTSDVFTEKRIQLSYTRDGHLLTGGFGAFWIDRDYKETELDRVIKLARVDLGYKFTAVLVGSAGLEYQHTEEFAIARVDKDILFRVGLNYRISRDVNLEFEVGHRKRDSNQPQSSFSEFRALLGIMYRFDKIPVRSLFSNR